MSNSNKLSGLALLFFMSSLYVNTNTILGGNLLAKHYFAIALGSILIVFFAVNLIFRKKDLRICLTNIEFALFFLLFYIGIRLLCMPLGKGYLNNYIVIIVFIVFVETTKKLFIQVAKDTLIKYPKVPKNGLFWLRNNTGGREEQVFTIDQNKKQHWPGSDNY